MESANLWPLVVYIATALFLVAAMMAASYLLGQRHGAAAMREPFESGIVPVGSARLRLSVKFYVTAILFVIFDMETVFLFAWAVAFRETGWTGYVAALIFIAILIAALVYEWRLGALDWAPTSRKLRKPVAG